MNSQQRNGGLLVGLAAAAALMMALLPKAGPGPEAGKHEKGPKASTGETRQDDTTSEGPLAPIRRFLGPRATASKQSPWASERRFTLHASKNAPFQLVEEKYSPAGNADFYTWPKDKGLKDCSLRFLIATVPDPADSGLAFQFDQTLESLQRAFEQGQYVIDRAWLPWQRSASGKTPDQRLHEKHPGLILFRTTFVDKKDDNKKKDVGNKQKHKLLALLLVGETATAGIHKEAFRNAVRVVRECPKHVRDPADPVRLRVIGPYFSGSALSLRMELEKVRHALAKKRPPAQEPLIKVVCGSASGFNPKEFVDKAWIGNGAKRAAFQTTILPSRMLLHWLRKYLGDPAKPGTAKPAGPIGILHEANTGFGQDLVAKLRKRDPKRGESEPPDYFLVPYPLHISQLRSSYTREQLARLESQGLPRAGRDLPFPSERGVKADKGHEAIQAQAPLLTAAINDLVIDNLVTTISQKRGRYICLISTDPQDVIFLGRRVRDRYPDVQLATIGSNLLFTHEEYNSALRGMVVASTYPLYPSVQGWSQPNEGQKSGRLRSIFADDVSEGCYNAVLVHLNDTKEARSKLSLLDYGWEATAEHPMRTLPPIWISVVGDNGQMIPVTCISPSAYVKDTGMEDKNGLAFVHTGDHPRLPKFTQVRAPSLVFLVFVALLAVDAYCFFWLAWRMVRESPWDATADGLCSRYKQRVDFGVVCLAQILLFGPISEWAWTPVKAIESFRSCFLPNLGSLGLLVASPVMMIFAWIFLVKAHLTEPFAANETRWARLQLIAGGQPLWVFGKPRVPSTATPPSNWLLREWLKKIWVQGGFWIVVADCAMFLLVSVTLLYYMAINCVAFGHPLNAEDVLRFERLAHLSNGASSLLPHVLLCTALFGWGFCLVKKLYLASHHAVDPPFPEKPKFYLFKALRDLDKSVRAELVPPSTLRIHFWKCVGIFALTSIATATLWQDHIPPLDGMWFGDCMVLAFGAGAFLLLFTLLQFYMAWRALRKMLRFLALLPMQNAFGRLSDKVLSLFGHYLFSLRPRHSHLAVSVQQFEILRRLYPAFTQAVADGACGMVKHPLGVHTLATVWVEIQAIANNPRYAFPLTQDFAGELDAVEERDNEPPPKHAPTEREWGAKAGEDCRMLAEQCLRILCRLWPAQSLQGAFGGASQAGESAQAQAPIYLSLPEGDPIRAWAIAAEDFAAGEILRYLSQFTAQLRTLLTSLTGASLLLVLAATVYPFFPQYELLLGLTVLGGVVAAGIAVFLVQLNRDELVSRVSRSTPNRFTPDLAFLQGTATFVLPILAAVTIQFPIVTSSIRSLLDPLFHIIR